MTELADKPQAFGETERQTAELAAMRRMLDASRGTFSISIAICNSVPLRDFLIERLKSSEPVIEVVSMPAQMTDVYGAACKSASSDDRSALFLIDLDKSVSSADEKHAALESLNASRELWKTKFHCPVVFWLPEYAATLLCSEARDFWSWRSHQFEFVSEMASASAGVADRFAGSVELAANLSADQKQFRIAELEQRVAEAGDPPIAELKRHVAVWLNELGVLYDVTGWPTRAIPWYEKSLAIARQIGYRRGEAQAMGNLGSAYAKLGEPRRAIAYYEQDLAIAHQTGDRVDEVGTLGNLGTAYCMLGEPRRAVEYLEQGLAIARHMKSRHREGQVLSNLGTAYYLLGERREAAQYYEQALVIARQLADRRTESSTLANLGIACVGLGEPRRAIDYCERAAGIAREIDDRRGEANALGNLGDAYGALGEDRRAMEYYEQQRTIAREVGDRREEARANWNMGLAYAKLGDLHQALDLMQVLVDYEREIGYPDADKRAAVVQGLRERLGKGQVGPVIGD